MYIGALCVGFVLDLLWGDPRWLPHPVVLLGHLISGLEKLVRRVAGADANNLMAGGFFLVLVVCSVAFCVPYFLLAWLHRVAPWLAWCVEAFLCFQIFATRSLADAAREVYKSLTQSENLDAAREKLSYIVGRDTRELSKTEIIKAAIETVAENTSDGVIAPLFYLLLGGVPLGMFYKAVNTMDSMLAYRTADYLYIGRCAAKLDDAANFLPARLSAFLLLLAVKLMNLNVAQAWQIFRRDRYNHLSPNSAQTESVVAGALQLQLGGGHYYFGEFVPKKTIGEAGREPEPRDILRTNQLLYTTAVAGLVLGSLISWLVQGIG